MFVAGTEKHVALSYKERSRKLRIASDKLGYPHPLDLLADYEGKETVPGICTNAACECITNVAFDAEYDTCPNCRTYTIASILTLGDVL